MDGIKLYILFCVWLFCFRQCFWDSSIFCVCISSSFLLLSRIPYYEYSTIFLALFSAILIMLVFIPWFLLKSQDGCCSSSQHMQITPFKGQEKLFLFCSLRNLSRSLLKNIPSCFIGQNHITCPFLNQTLAEGMGFPWLSQTSQDSHLGLRRGSTSPEECGSLVPEQNQGSVSTKRRQSLLINNQE